jgi:hypothetical protein
VLLNTAKNGSGLSAAGTSSRAEGPEYCRACRDDGLPCSRGKRGADGRPARSVGGVLWIGVWHPFVSGRLSRWLRIEKMIEYMLGTGEVWFARLEDIARHVLALHESGEYDIRIDRLPYYDQLQIPDPPPSPTVRGSA